VEDSRPAPASRTRGHPLRHRSQPEQTPWLGEAAITLTTTYAIRVRIPPLPIGCAKGSAKAVARSTISSSWEPTTTSPGCAARPPRLRLNSSWRMRAQRESAGPTAGLSSPERPSAKRCQQNGLLLHLRPSWCSRLRRGPFGVTRRTKCGCCSKTQGGRGAASWQSARRFFCTRNQARRGSGQWRCRRGPVPTGHKAEQVPVSRAGRQQSTRPAAGFTPALLEGAEARLPPDHPTRPQGSAYAAVGLVVPPLQQVGELGVAFTPD